MDKIKPIAIATLVLVLIIVGTVLADGPEDGPTVPTPRDGDVSTFDASSEFDIEGGEPMSYIYNGAFDDWAADGPDGWTIWSDEKSGWEDARFSQVDLAEGGGMNDALGFFMRNVGGDGGYYAGAVQPLTRVTSAGYYFVSVSETIWYGGETGPYNSVAWYAISASASPAGVASSEWRELDPYTIQCHNSSGSCVYSGRDETVWIDPGTYFHLMVGMKFPFYNAWSFFVIDDISIVPAGGVEDTVNGFYDWVNDSPEDVKWHFEEETCWDCEPTQVEWDPEATH